MLFYPSYHAGFARSEGEAEYPELWRDLVGLYGIRLGVTGETVHDLSGHGHHAGFGSGLDAGDWVLGQAPRRPGYAITFPASQGGLVISPGLVLSSTFTCWMSAYFTTSDTFSVLFGETGGTGDGIYYKYWDDVISFYYSGADHVNDTTISEPGYHQIAVVNEAGNITFYLDGKADGTDTGAPDLTVNYIGSNPAWQGFGGDIDYMLMYDNRALTPNEIYRMWVNPFYDPLTLRQIVLGRVPIAITDPFPAGYNRRFSRAYIRM